MSSVPGFDASAALADLRKKWDHLSDVGRGETVHKLHDAGMSYWKLAQVLPCSATQLRNLDKVAQADEFDRFMSERGQISTRELVRRVEASKKKSAQKEKEALEKKRRQEAEEGSKLICDWLEEQGVLPSVGAAIVRHAYRHLAEAEIDGTLPSWPPPPRNVPVAQLIESKRPPNSVDAETGSHGWFAIWLANWSLLVIPDGTVREKALAIAEEVLHWRSPVRFF